MAYSFGFSVALDADDTGLTLYGQLVDSDGNNVGAQIAAGWVEIGEGNYYLLASVPDDHRGGLEVYNDADDELQGFGAINTEEAELIDHIHADILHIPAYAGGIWYVSATGNDANDGDHPASPFLTLGHAITVAAAAGDRIVVKAGTYVEAGLDMDLAGLELIAEHGTILTSGGAGTCLVVSAGYCSVEGFLLIPGAAQIGLDVQAGGTFASVCDCLAFGCSVGFDIDGLQSELRNCRSIGHTVTGFDINAGYGLYDSCESQGGGAVRGYYLSGAGADGNVVDNCQSLGNTTAGFEVVIGADGNCFGGCVSGGGDGARIDAGANNSWPGYSVGPTLVIGDQMDLVNAPNATAITAIQNGLAVSATALSNLTWTNAKAAFLDVAISSRAAATTFAGITSLAHWLRGLYRSSVMEAVAKGQVNTGGGSYDEATNSNEAIADTEPLGTAMRGTDGAALAETALSNTVWTNAKAAFLDGAISGVAMAVWNTLTSALTTVGSIGKKLADATWGVISVGVTPYLLSGDQEELEVRWGDEVTISFTLYAADDSEYDFSDTAHVYFTVKRGDHLFDTDDANAVIGDGAPKAMVFDPAVAGAASVTLLAEDTKRCDMDKPYRFDIEIVNSTGNSPVTAIVGKFKSTTTVTRTSS